MLSNQSLIALSIVVALALGEASAAAAEREPDPQTLAKSHFALGVKLNKEGRLEAALEAFRRAQALAPHPVVQCNIGALLVRLERPVEAIDVLEECSGHPDLADKQRKLFQEQYDQVRAQLSRLELQVTPASASVAVDGEPRSGASDSFWLAAGTHQVRVTAPHHIGQQFPVALPAGETVMRSVDLVQLKGTLSVECDRAGEPVWVDDESMGVTPLSPVALGAGEHRIRFDNGPERPLFVPSGGSAAALCPRRPVTKPVVAAPPPRATDNPSPQRDGLHWSGYGMLVGAGVAGLTAGGIAWYNERQIEEVGLSEMKAELTEAEAWLRSNPDSAERDEVARRYEDTRATYDKNRASAAGNRALATGFGIGAGVLALTGVSLLYFSETFTLSAEPSSVGHGMAVRARW